MGEQRRKCGLMVWTLVALLSVQLETVTGVAVMSIDLGNEWLKIAIVSPGKPMEIVLNTDSARKTPHVVAFRDNERFFGEAALTTSTRFPDKAFHYLLDVIGKPYDSSEVEQYRRRFPHTIIEQDNVTGGVLFKHPDGETYTPIELLAMLLHKSRQYAELAAGEGVKIRDIVIAVPPYFNYTERYIVNRSAELAGLKVLQVINGNTAVALNYGLFRTKDFAVNKSSRVMFFDMGASGTTATIADYTLIETKEKGFTERIPKLTILGVGHDRNLGGFEMQLRLRDHLAELFSEQRKVPLEKVLSNKRAMSKLLKEAARVKRVLSANSAINAQVENVMDDKDLKAQVTRQKFEELCDDLLGERIQTPVKQALVEAKVTMADIDHVILFGGNSRIPKVQEQLSIAVQGKELGKSVNSDEAAALGAAYQAAFLVKTFKIKPFNISDPYDPMAPVETPAAPAVVAAEGEQAEQPAEGGGEEPKEEKEEEKPEDVVAAAAESTSVESLKPAMDIDSESFKAWQVKLKALNKKDYERAKRESTRNTLESFVMEMRTILEDEQHTKEPKADAERQALINELDSAAELLEGSPSLQDLQDKLVKVRKSVGDFHQKLLQIKLDEIARKERDSGFCSPPKLLNLLLGRTDLKKKKQPSILQPNKLEL